MKVKNRGSRRVKMPCTGKRCPLVHGHLVFGSVFTAVHVRQSRRHAESVEARKQRFVVHLPVGQR